MPRFFFNVFDDRAILDTDGVLLPDAVAAREEGVRIAGGIIERDAGRIATSVGWTLEVMDAAGQRVCCVNLAISVA